MYIFMTAILMSEADTMYSRQQQDWKGVIRTGIHACVLCKF
jgi:hypothetical protein